MCQWWTKSKLRSRRCSKRHAYFKFNNLIRVFAVFCLELWSRQHFKTILLAIVSKSTIWKLKMSLDLQKSLKLFSYCWNLLRTTKKLYTGGRRTSFNFFDCFWQYRLSPSAFFGPEFCSGSTQKYPDYCLLVVPEYCLRVIEIGSVVSWVRENELILVFIIWLQALQCWFKFTGHSE